MKGMIFQKPLEFQLVVEGETWRQGDPLRGTLTVVNHGGASPEGVHVTLAYATLRDAQANAPDAFEKVARVEMGAAGGDWTFQTDANCPMTDKAASLFILYGQGEDTTKIGKLQLSFLPALPIEEFVTRLRIEHKFVVKAQKSRKGWIETKLAPPTSRGYSSVELLALSCRFKGETLETSWLFTMKKLDASAGMALKKDQKELEQKLERADYRTPSGRFNHERVEAAILEVIGQLNPGTAL